MNNSEGVPPLARSSPLQFSQLRLLPQSCPRRLREWCSFQHVYVERHLARLGSRDPVVERDALRIGALFGHA
jgi:hypothetical protein